MSEQVQAQLQADSILSFLEAHADQLKAMGVVKLGLFGSYVRGEQTPESDLDFLVQMRSPSYRDFMKVWHFLEDSFGKEVDLGEEHLIREEIKARVLQDVRYVAGL
jgi:uncharacterized protein